MDYKKIKTDNVAITRNVVDFDSPTGNLYESICIVSKRANTIGLELKEELNRKISEFTTTTDNLEEVFENREQIEIARYYEQIPKPTLLAIHEWLHGNIYYRNPVKEESGSNF